MTLPILVCNTAGDAPLDVERARSHLLIDAIETDDYLEGLIAAVNGLVDGETGCLGRALLTQTWTLKLDSFYSCKGKSEIVLPLAPLQTVNSVKYRNTANTLITMSASEYRVINRGNMPSSIIPPLNGTWPTTVCDNPEAVEINFTCGYGDNASDVPQSIIQAQLLMLGHWHANRENVSALDLKQIPMGASALLAPYTLNWFS